MGRRSGRPWALEPGEPCRCNAVTVVTGRNALPPTGPAWYAVTVVTGRNALPPAPAGRRELIVL
jgi:hypothetical protein